MSARADEQLGTSSPEPGASAASQDLVLRLMQAASDRGGPPGVRRLLKSLQAKVGERVRVAGESGVITSEGLKKAVSIWLREGDLKGTAAA